MPSFNYVIAKASKPLEDSRYTLENCQGDTCIYKRQGSCQVIPGYHINQILQQLGG